MCFWSRLVLLTRCCCAEAAFLYNHVRFYVHVHLYNMLLRAVDNQLALFVRTTSNLPRATCHDREHELTLA